ncbi:uncharacterized protein LOC114738734 [Neltuma alba]|uniref:uncharacterized protein LOC114738734 n=1 Tax=Neltuma alba TaxID=207710 RepID=UPI0010A4A989|nr:uncharacterized protein LOC114738734 [Prosopis alba]
MSSQASRTSRRKRKDAKPQVYEIISMEEFTPLSGCSTSSAPDKNPDIRPPTNGDQPKSYRMSEDKPIRRKRRSILPQVIQIFSLEDNPVSASLSTSSHTIGIPEVTYTVDAKKITSCELPSQQNQLQTQPSEVISIGMKDFRRKDQQSLCPLKDITNLASNLSKRFNDETVPGKPPQRKKSNDESMQATQMTKRLVANYRNIGQSVGELFVLTTEGDIFAGKLHPSSTSSVPQDPYSSTIRAAQCQSMTDTQAAEIVDYSNIDFAYGSDHDDEIRSDRIEEDSNIEAMASTQHERLGKDKTIENVTTIDEFGSTDYMDEGDPIHQCKYCQALLWYNERVKKDQKRNVNMFSICCLQGKVQIPFMKSPPPILHDLFFNKNSAESKNFHCNIRQYNNMFTFTSLGGNIDHSKNRGGGPYSFIMHGVNYHSIGSLLPPEGARPVFSQLYIYDTDNEVANRISAVCKHQEKTSIDPKIVKQIKEALDAVNPFVQQYRAASSRIIGEDCHDLKLCLISSREHDGRTFNLPSASEVAALVVGDVDMAFNVRDVIVEQLSGSIQHISELHPAYLPLQYPILFPFGEDGYRHDIEHREDTLSSTKKKKRLSMREYFTFRLMVRENEASALLHARRLLQQFVVDGYTMIESQRLLWIRTHQKELRVDLYQGLSDALTSGERDASSTGRRIILPSSFTGGARYMILNYQDAMAICRWAGYPDIFITFTCNPAWPEITRFCKKHSLQPSDRPDILCRVFKMKLQTLMKTIKEEKLFGTVRAEVYTIEFQKRGLPHAHILLFLDPRDKLKNPEDVDAMICAEIPDKNTSPLLYELVKKFMVHGPCGAANPKSPCMKDHKCSKYFPKKYNSHTTIDDDGYPTYRRRNDGRIIDTKSIPLDNRYVVPYNPLLLRRFQAHINVEKCNQSTAIKYLFKYISKGNDRVVAGIFDDNGGRVFDEIQQYYNCRYISACEASWRIFGFDIHHRHPSVERLSFHLPNQQAVIYCNTDDVADLLDKPRVSESQFLAWMKLNIIDAFAQTLTYSEFPNHYVYKRDKREWRKRKKGFAVGRITHVSPTAGELYYLRILLTKVRGPRSFDEIKTVNGVVHSTFREACFALGLLDDDREYIVAINEASSWASGNALRKMFVSMLLCCCLSRPENVWKETSKLLAEDLLYIPRQDANTFSDLVSLHEKEQLALIEIDKLLQSNGKSLDSYPTLPRPTYREPLDVTNHLILQELKYDRQALQIEAEQLIAALTVEQKDIFNKILNALEGDMGDFFFVYGYGGTGKTFLWNALTSSLRSAGKIVLTVASSGIAATLLPSGRTAHSRFAIPIQITEYSLCSIKHNSALAKLIQCTKLIIWDEAPMVQRHCIEAFDRTLKDIMHCSHPFGGKCVVMGGDFRQILPVIPKGTRASVVNACISSSFLWGHCTMFQLTKNMRLQSSASNQDNERLERFSNWLLAVGDGRLGESNDGIAEIEIPPELLVSKFSNPIEAIVSSTYVDLMGNLGNSEYFNNRAILAPTIDHVNQINDYMCSLLPGDSYEYLSCDTVCKSTEDSDSFDNLYTTEFLNTINSSGLPPHKLYLKVGAPIMLLRNIDQASGLCNGTRLQISKLGKNVIEAITLNGSCPNHKVLLHRMDMNPSESRWPFRMQRRQFPVTLSFAMTINKSQGQSLRNVGLFLTRPVFTHGQLYVALSRVRSMDGLKIIVDECGCSMKTTTTNVVYREIFSNLLQ